jgi:DNA-binding winged helix-turn-helix (wHTH) protein/dienelactone hydrolase
MATQTAWTQIDLAREADFALGDSCVRPTAREVEAAAGKTTLEPRVMQVLVALARHPGSVVSRDELIARCWAGRVVGDDAIHRCIARLRRLADSHGGFEIETVPKVGYRLTARAPSPHPTAVGEPTPIRRFPARIAVAAAAALAVVAAAAWSLRDAGVDRAAPESIVAEIAALERDDRYAEAFRLALPLVQAGRLEEDSSLGAAWQKISLPMKPLVAEDGATVYFKGYSEADADWIEAGVTPFAATVAAPRGTLRLKVTKPGFRTAYFAVANPGPMVENDSTDQPFLARNRGLVGPLPLSKVGAVPDDMVVVPRTDIPVWVPGWTLRRQGEARREIPEFLIGRTEVTNRQFKEFIDAGGYDNPVYWEGLTFVSDGHTLSWADARAKFVDSTHRPGPAEWALSTYPAGLDSHPVGGISWYEAVAYARFRGATLPTIHHWARAAFGPFDPRFNVAPSVALASRFSSPGPVSADAELGLGPWGTLHMSGNVREWLWNFAGENALAPGGAWLDYATQNWGTFPVAPMDRSPANGVRLMQPPADAELHAELQAPIQSTIDGDLRPIAPASDEAFAALRAQFDRAHVAPIDTDVSVVQETPLAIAEEIVLTFADADPATFYIVRPRAPAKPLQPIVYAPAANCCVLKRPNREALEQLQDADFVVDGGRALIIPIWFGSYQRFLPAAMDAQERADRERESALAWHRDLRIVLDYLETRRDVDVERAGFLGTSMGSVGQGIALALEPRLKAAVLISSGLVRVETVHPLADMMNYAPRITMPVLMINGRMDHLFPYATSQQALLNLLGTDAEEKGHITYDGGHYQYRRNSVARNVTDWFDRYLGSAR